jgi:hypothetical protein
MAPPESTECRVPQTAPVVPQTLDTSCDLLIFVNQSTKPVASSDVVGLAHGGVR